MRTDHVNLNFTVYLDESEQTEMTDENGKKFTLTGIGCSSYDLKRGRVTLGGPGVNKDGSRALVNRSTKGLVADLDPGIAAHIDQVLFDLAEDTAGGLDSYQAKADQ